MTRLLKQNAISILQRICTWRTTGPSSQQTPDYNQHNNEIDILYYIFTKKKVLLIIWGNDGLGRYLPTSYAYGKNLKEYIKNNVESIYKKFVIEIASDIYILDISSDECLGAFSWDSGGWKAKYLIKKQLETFLPIIQKFIVDA